MCCKGNRVKFDPLMILVSFWKVDKNIGTENTKPQHLWLLHSNSQSPHSITSVGGVHELSSVYALCNKNKKPRFDPRQVFPSMLFFCFYFSCSFLENGVELRGNRAPLSTEWGIAAVKKNKNKNKNITSNFEDRIHHRRPPVMAKTTSANFTWHVSIRSVVSMWCACVHCRSDFSLSSFIYAGNPHWFLF